MDATVILIFIIIGLIFAIYFAYQAGKKLGESEQNHKWQEAIPKIREDATKRSRAVIGGQFSEQLAPFLPNFPYKPTECRFVGKPIDIIVFEGMDDKEITNVRFIEIKSGDSKLSTHERKLRDAIKDKRITWEEYRIPKELTKK